jgi:hypothetical protein
MKIRQISPSALKTSRFLRMSWLKRKQSLHHHSFQQKKKLSSEDIFKKILQKNKKPSYLKMFIEANHATEMKI